LPETSVIGHSSSFHPKARNESMDFHDDGLPAAAQRTLAKPLNHFDAGY
jgi:hypothetical protein